MQGGNKRRFGNTDRRRSQTPVPLIRGIVSVVNMGVATLEIGMFCRRRHDGSHCSVIHLVVYAWCFKNVFGVEKIWAATLSVGLPNSCVWKNGISEGGDSGRKKWKWGCGSACGGVCQNRRLPWVWSQAVGRVGAIGRESGLSRWRCFHI
jgi:hypothetical protein